MHKCVTQLMDWRRLIVGLGAAQGPNIRRRNRLQLVRSIETRGPQTGRQDQTVSSWDGVLVWTKLSRETDGKRRTVPDV
jgi:hypothetical protein